MEPEDAKPERETPDAETEEARGGPLPPASFAAFLQGLARQCLIAMGDLDDPVSGRREQDLEQAKFTLDLLQILEEKTKGNLDEDEEKALGALLYQLRIRYLDAARG